MASRRCGLPGRRLPSGRFLDNAHPTIHPPAVPSTYRQPNHHVTSPATSGELYAWLKPQLEDGGPPGGDLFVRAVAAAFALPPVTERRDRPGARALRKARRGICCANDGTPSSYGPVGCLDQTAKHPRRPSRDVASEGTAARPRWASSACSFRFDLLTFRQGSAEQALLVLEAERVQARIHVPHGCVRSAVRGGSGEVQRRWWLPPSLDQTKCIGCQAEIAKDPRGAQADRRIARRSVSRSAKLRAHRHHGAPQQGGAPVVSRSATARADCRWRCYVRLGSWRTFGNDVKGRDHEVSPRNTTIFDLDVGGGDRNRHPQPRPGRAWTALRPRA